jgi:hypothetical protein
MISMHCEMGTTFTGLSAIHRTGSLVLKLDFRPGIIVGENVLQPLVHGEISKNFGLRPTSCGDIVHSRLQVPLLPKRRVPVLFSTILRRLNAMDLCKRIITPTLIPFILNGPLHFGRNVLTIHLIHKSEDEIQP